MIKYVIGVCYCCFKSPTTQYLSYILPPVKIITRRSATRGRLVGTFIPNMIGANLLVISYWVVTVCLPPRLLLVTRVRLFSVYFCFCFGKSADSRLHVVNDHPAESHAEDRGHLRWENLPWGRPQQVHR